MKKVCIKLIGSHKETFLPGESKDIHFEFGVGTETFGACSMTIKGRHFLFGGDKEKKQVISLINTIQ